METPELPIQPADNAGGSLNIHHWPQAQEAQVSFFVFKDKVLHVA